MSWKNKQVNFGLLKVGRTVSAAFEYLGEGKYVSSKTSCGCTVANWDKSKKVLETKYTPKAIPVHLKNAGKDTYDSLKYVMVTMVEDGLVKNYNLEIKAKVYE
jgi:hypothetical protein